MHPNDARRPPLLLLLALSSGLLALVLSWPLGAADDNDSGARPADAPRLSPLCSSAPYSYYGSDLVPSPAYAEDRTLFFIYSPQLWRSQDDGASWQVVYRPPFVDEEINSLATLQSSTASDVTLYVRHWHYRRQLYGIARSTNTGNTWEERTACDPNCFGLFVTNRPETIFAVRAEPPFPTESGLGILRSDDGGLSWQVLWDESNAVYLYVSPTFAEDATLFAAVGGLLRTSDGGMTWQRQQGEPAPGSLLVFSPDFAHDHTLLTLQQHTLFKSQDGGLSWRPLFRFGDETQFADLEVSPNYAEDRTLFVATLDTILVSYDDGANWSVVRVGLREPDLDVRRQSGAALPAANKHDQRRAAPTLTGAAFAHRLYLPFAGNTGVRYRPLSLFLSTQAGSNIHYYQSGDGGATWNCLNAPLVR